MRPTKLIDSMSFRSEKGDSLSKVAIAVIIVIAICLRLAVAIYLGNNLDDPQQERVYDQNSYDGLARRVLEGHGFSMGVDWWPLTKANAPTAHWSYLYVLYLAGVYAIFGYYLLAARIIQ
jgi:hypothetical protein